MEPFFHTESPQRTLLIEAEFVFLLKVQGKKMLVFCCRKWNEYFRLFVCCDGLLSAFVCLFVCLLRSFALDLFICCAGLLCLFVVYNAGLITLVCSVSFFVVYYAGLLCLFGVYHAGFLCLFSCANLLSCLFVCL